MIVVVCPELESVSRQQSTLDPANLRSTNLKTGVETASVEWLGKTEWMCAVVAAPAVKSPCS